ncbi:MAG TPA: TetR/AcrR family transcriptional regulator [Herpetosiphonaceae bacterium]
MEEQRDETVFPDILAALDLPRVPQQTRSRQKRDALLAAAARLFEERGYDATTADDIADAAGVSIGTFYSYFRNKRQVFLTLYAASVEDFLALRITEIDFSTHPLQAIRETVRRALQRDQLFYGLRRAWSELLPRDPEIAGYNEQMNRLVCQQMIVAAHKIVAQGLTWPDLDIEPTCWAITLLLDQVWHTLPGPKEASEAEIDRQQEALVQVIYHALFRTP